MKQIDNPPIPLPLASGFAEGIILSSFLTFTEGLDCRKSMCVPTAVYGLTSLLIWPGIGQYLNDNETKKNWTHALLGLTGIFRLWSGWDAMIARQGGRLDGKI